jgi:hypothetical protein
MRRFSCAGAPSPAWFTENETGAAMNLNADLDPVGLELDDIPEEVFPIRDSIGLTFASGIHESDLLSFMERARRLAGEVC